MGAMMDWQGWLTIGLTLGVLLALVFTSLTSEIVLMAALIILSFAGILDAKTALAGFSNEGLITVAAMFIVAAGIRASGGVELFVNILLGSPKTVRGALCRLVLPVIPMSAFVNNTPIVATLIPAVSGWSKRIGVSPSMLMIPLSYAASLGGTVTLIGTSTNLVINSQYKVITGKDGLHLFDMTPIGVLTAVIGVAYLIFLIPLLLPKRQSTSEQFADRKKFTFEVAVAANGVLVGKSIVQAGLRQLGGIYLAEIDRGGTIITAVSPEEILYGGDRLVFVGETSAIFDILRINGLVASKAEHPSIEKDVPERCLVEAVVSSHCDCIGSTLRDSHFRDRYGAVVLAIARDGEAIQGNLASIELESGDVLLLEARPSFVTQQRVQRDFLLINDLGEERPNHALAKVSWAILLLIVCLATFNVVSMLNAAMLGAALMIMSGCCSVSEARRSLDIMVIITIASGFALGAALQKTDAAHFIAEYILTLADGNAWLLLALTYITLSILTEIISNNAAGLLMLPIVLAMTKSLGLHDEPFVIATMMAASASFATPIGYQTNLMVYGPGGYQFKDFLKVGIPLKIIVAAISIGLIPLIWPLSG